MESPRIKLAEYLFQRLRQLGVESLHGVPGDYNLSLLDYVEPAGLRWVGNANELNAAYAADGYARIRGIGALVTTFGVGELSAINAIAGAYTERAPVVHIVGIPARESHDSRLLIHHTFNDGEYQRFAQMHAQVTVAQTRLWDVRTSQQQIDDVLHQCLFHSRPVYLEMPVDLVDAYVESKRLESPVRIAEVQYEPAKAEILSQVIGKIRAAKKPLIVADGEIRPMGIVKDVQKLVGLTGWPTWTTGFGKGLLDETVSNFHGIYQGGFDKAEVRDFFNEADLILCFGPHWSSTNTYAYTAIPKSDVTIAFSDTEIILDNSKHRDIPVKHAISEILKEFEKSQVFRYEPYPDLPRDYKLPLPSDTDDQLLTQDRMWRVLANILCPGDIIMGETGTAGYGVREMPLPKDTRVFVPVTWLSIGYMLPGAQGAALAQQEKNPDGRTILVIGDGSFQMTVQELSTIIHHDLNVIIVLLNNDGYTIERCLHGRKQKYNDIAPWRYLQAPSLFGAREDTYTASAKTFAELGRILTDAKFTDSKGLRMIELFADREDAPPGPLLWFLNKQKD